MERPQEFIRSRAAWIVVLVLCGGASVAAPMGSIRAAEIDFERQIAPLLVQRCLECHQSRDPSGQLSLATWEGAKAGGESGAAIVPGRPQESYLLDRVTAGEMPPPRLGHSRKLPDAEIELLRQWIAAGASWPAGRTLDLYERTSDARGGRDWWSFQPLRLRVAPTPRATDLARTPVDAFILEQLEARELSLAPPAEPRALLRRMSVDLTGLVPSADHLDEFAADKSPDALAREVDRLLASPRFGERWARHWLDLARFADTSGYERDQEKPHAWRYRDWVISAINRDLPYDDFIRQQLAGDELPERSESTVIATGFLRLGTWNDEPNDPQEYKYERLEDLVHATSTAFLALTIKCARCHDHKFDPVPQTDYYRMASTFWSGPLEPRGRELLGGPTREELGFDVLGWTDLTSTPRPLNLLKKGDPTRPGPVVAPGYLSLLPALDRPPQVASTGKTTTLRRQLAEWLVERRNPLTPRVAVNRLWLHHFGQGLVRSPNNFGFQGERPTHPELLDWLAAQLLRDNWQQKPLHRELLLSAVYGQSAQHPRHTEYAQRDFANRSWWRAERRRLDAESLRDAMLTASGRIDLRMSGPSFKPNISAEALEGLSRKSGAWQASPFREQARRSVYSYAQRSLLPPLLTVFDLADTTLPCGQRDVSTVAPQALALLNGEFAHEQSEVFAQQLWRDEPRDAERRIRHAWRSALGREPSTHEFEAANEHLAAQRVNFARRANESNAPAPVELPSRKGLVLHLAADQGVKLDGTGRIERWEDQSGAAHHATQDRETSRPKIVAATAGRRPMARFDGQGSFLHLSGQVLSSQQFTVLAVVRDDSASGHREIFSNWNGAAGNSTTSVFVGLTGQDQVRLSDDFSGVGHVASREQLFLLTAVSGARDAVVRQNGQDLARKSSSLASRILKTPYVVGQQGNIQGEYWKGDIAELVVFDRELSEKELHSWEESLARRYELVVPPSKVKHSAEFLAWASLCHVLLNCNEFAYVD